MAASPQGASLAAALLYDAVEPADAGLSRRYAVRPGRNGGGGSTASATA
ncbi:hypothetical protein KAURM247S_01964 [Kitasatospora aureofaciens]